MSDIYEKIMAAEEVGDFSYDHLPFDKGTAHISDYRALHPDFYKAWSPYEFPEDRLIRCVVPLKANRSEIRPLKEDDETSRDVETELSDEVFIILLRAKTSVGDGTVYFKVEAEHVTLWFPDQKSHNSFFYSQREVVELRFGKADSGPNAMNLAGRDRAIKLTPGAAIWIGDSASMAPNWDAMAENALVSACSQVIAGKYTRVPYEFKGQRFIIKPKVSAAAPA